MLCCPDNEDLPLAADARIHDCEVDRLRREISASGSKGKRAGTNGSGRDVMSDVHDLNSRIDAQNDAFHRADEPVGVTEVRRQSDHAHAAFITDHAYESQTNGRTDRSSS